MTSHRHNYAVILRPRGVPSKLLHTNRGAVPDDHGKGRRPCCQRNVDIYIEHW